MDRHRKTSDLPGTANGGSMQRFVGLLGEFTDALGRVCPCRVIQDPYAKPGAELLHVRYWNRRLGQPAEGWISVTEFRQDKQPNTKYTNI